MRRFILALLLLPFLLLSADAANRFAVCTVTCTWDGASTAMWSTTTGGGTGASVPGTGDAVILDAATCVGGVTCTITVNTTVTVQSITMGACTAATTGCILDFSVNNNNVTLSANTGLNGSGSGTRTLSMGGGTWTFTGAGTLLNFGTTTNLTFTGSSTTFVFTATTLTTRLLSLPTATFGTFTLSANTLGGLVAIASGSTTTIGTLNITGPNVFVPASSVTTTVTNAMNINGSSTAQIFIHAGSEGTTGTISSANNGTFTWCAFRDLTFSGGGTFTATSSFDLGHNSGITITAPSTASGPNIIGGYLLDPANDNTPLFLDKAA